MCGPAHEGTPFKIGSHGILCGPSQTNGVTCYYDTHLVDWTDNIGRNIVEYKYSACPNEWLTVTLLLILLRLLLH